MTRNFLRWLLLWPLLVLPALAAADMVALDPSMQGVPLGRFLEYQVDTTGKASLEQVRARPDWQPLAVDVPNFGLAMPVHWFRLELQVADPNRPWLLEIGYGEMDKLDFYLLDESGRPLEQRELGVQRPDAKGRVLHLRPVIPLRLRQPGVMSLYFRVESSRGMQFPLLLWQQEDFIVQDEMNNLTLGLFFGMLVVLLLYNFFLFAVLRHRLYLEFALFMAALILFHCQLRGISLRFFWPGQIQLNASVWLGSGLLSIFCGVLFADHFLQLEQRGFPLLKLLRLTRWLALLAVFMVPWLGTELGVYGLVLLTLTATLMLMISVFYHYQTNNRPVQLFAMGWVVLVAGVLILAGNRTGLLPVNLLTEHAVSVATLAQFMLFSMALSHRVNHEKALSLQRGAQRLAALQEECALQSQQLRAAEMQRNADSMALQLQTATNERLAREIDDSGAALEQASQRLRELSRMDPLTGLYNRNHCNERLREEFERSARAGQPASLILVSVDQFAQVCERWGVRAGDQLLRMVAEWIQAVTQHHCASLFQFEEKVFAVLLPGMSVDRTSALAETIRAAIGQQPFVQGSIALPVTVSAGVGTLVPQPFGRPESWVRLAQQALNRARQQGGDRVCVEAPPAGVAHG